MKLQIFILDEGDKLLADKTYSIPFDTSLDGTKVPLLKTDVVGQTIGDMIWDALNPK